MANQLAEYDGEDLVDQELVKEQNFVSLMNSLECVFVSNCSFLGCLLFKKQLRISKEKTEEKVSSEKLQTFKLRMDDKQIVIEHKVSNQIYLFSQNL